MGLRSPIFSFFLLVCFQKLVAISHNHHIYNVYRTYHKYPEIEEKKSIILVPPPAPSNNRENKNKYMPHKIFRHKVRTKKLKNYFIYINTTLHLFFRGWKKTTVISFIAKHTRGTKEQVTIKIYIYFAIKHYH